MNFVLFSTSGVHGDHFTIEECEADPQFAVTFLIVQPRRVCLLYGKCWPEGPEDFAYLKKLRKTSWEVVTQIGAEE